jgi:hypothetical protein
MWPSSKDAFAITALATFNPTKAASTGDVERELLKQRRPNANNRYEAVPLRRPARPTFSCWLWCAPLILTALRKIVAFVVTVAIVYGIIYVMPVACPAGFHRTSWVTGTCVSDRNLNYQIRALRSWGFTQACAPAAQVQIGFCECKSWQSPGPHCTPCRSSTSGPWCNVSAP